MKLSSSLTLILSICCLLFTTISAKATPEDTQENSYQISGLPPNIQENVENRLKAAGPLPVERTEKEIILAIQPYGYFYPKIMLNMNKKHHYHVDLGPPMIIARTEIKIIGPGEKNHTIQEALKKRTVLKIGKIFKTPDYNKMQVLMFNLAHNHGYIKAEMVRHEVYINLEKNEASVYLTLNTGPLFYFGPTTFSPSPYNTNFLNRFLPFKQDEVYSPVAIQKLQESFLNSKYFSSASVNPNIDQAEDDDKVPVTIETEAVKSQQYAFGVGYGTNTGARTSIGVDLYRVTDTGQHFSTLMNLSETNTSMTTKYYIPGERPDINQYVIGTYLGEFRPDAGRAYTKQIFTGYETKLNDLWSSSSNLNFMHERFLLDNSSYHTTDLLYPSFNISRLSSDNPINPEKGSRITLDTSIGIPGSEEEFLQSQLSTKWIYPPTKNSFLILRGNLGATYASDYNEQFPLSMRFFAGGYNSVRGYSYQSLGPGKYLKVGSAEIQQRVYDQFYAGIFVDEGNASNTVTQPMERGIGLDFIYRTSVGPLSIDVAQANTSPGKPLSVEFNFGANL